MFSVLVKLTLMVSAAFWASVRGSSGLKKTVFVAKNPEPFFLKTQRKNSYEYRNGCVIDQYIETAVSVFDVFGKSVDTGFVRDVQLLVLDVRDALAGDLSQSFLAKLLISRLNNHSISSSLSRKAWARWLTS